MPATKNKPDFLVIGAMKSGTTTLYHDLLSHPDIFLLDKESNLLFTPDPASAYASAYQKSAANQSCGEVCPDYSKLPDFPDTIAKAKTLFSDSPPRIIYLVREPLSRTLSHHRFVSSRRDTRFTTMPSDINDCLEDHPELIHYSCYAMQIRPWIEAFGKSTVLTIRFEDFIQRRAITLKEIFTFLDLTIDHSSPAPNTIHNRSASRPVLTPAWQSLISTRFYRRLIRPCLNLTLRDKIRRWVLPSTSQNYIPPTAATQQQIIEQLRDDSAELQQLLELDAPLWSPPSSSRP